MVVPFDGKSSHTRLLRQYVSPHAVDVWLGWGLGIQLFRIVFVVDVVANSDELPAIVAACEENDCDAEYFGCRDASEIGGISFEYELVYTDGNGPNEERIELLVML